VIQRESETREMRREIRETEIERLREMLSEREEENRR
jgi:hypothetical protein